MPLTRTRTVDFQEAQTFLRIFRFQSWAIGGIFQETSYFRAVVKDLIHFNQFFIAIELYTRDQCLHFILNLVL